MTITPTAGHRRRARAQGWPREPMAIRHDLSVMVADPIRQAYAESAGTPAVPSACHCAPVACAAPDASPVAAELVARDNTPAPVRHGRPSPLQETPQASRRRRALICRPASPSRTVNHTGTRRRRVEEAP